MRKISFCEIWSFWSLFSRAPIRTLSLELFHITYYFYGPWKVLKKGAIMNMLEVILVQGFCPLKNKITRFSNGFRFNLVWINALFTSGIWSKIQKTFNDGNSFVLRAGRPRRRRARRNGCFRRLPFFGSTRKADPPRNGVCGLILSSCLWRVVLRDRPSNGFEGDWTWLEYYWLLNWLLSWLL